MPLPAVMFLIGMNFIPQKEKCVENHKTCSGDLKFGAAVPIDKV